MPLSIINLPEESLDGLDVEEITPSPHETIDENGFRAERIFKCPWANRLIAAARLKGHTHSTADGSVVNTRAHAYSGFSRAFVKAIDIEPWWSDGQAVPSGTVMAYTDAQLRVSYATAAFDTQDSPAGEEPQVLVSESLEPFAEFITLSHEKLYWDAAHTLALADTEAPSKIVRGCQWVFKVHSIPVVPTATFSLIGTINENAVVSRTLGITFAAKTLLYNPPRLERQITSEGFMTWSLEYRFTYRPTTWEKFYRKGVELPVPIYKANGTAFAPYEYGDFTKLVTGVVLA